MAHHNFQVEDDIDAIMAEMEEKTPASEVKNVDEVFYENSPEVVDARGFWSTPVKSKKPGHISASRPTNERYYDFTHPCPGAALIFNQVDIKGQEERKGSQKDADDLKKVLSDMNFCVKVCKNSTVRQIKDEVIECKNIL